MIWRVAFGLLLLANLLGLAGWAGWLDPWLGSSSQPSRIAEQVAPERLQVLAPIRPGLPLARPTDLPALAEAKINPAPDASAPAPVAGGVGATGADSASAPTGTSAQSAGPGAPAGATAQPAAPATPSPPQPAPQPAHQALARGCVEAGPIDEARLAGVRAWVKAPGDGLQAELDVRTEPKSYMIHLPPAASQAEAQRRVEQLRQKKVTDLFLIAEGPLRHAISLGIFRTQEGAQARQQELADRGVGGTRVSPMRLVERGWVKLRSAENLPPARWTEAVSRLGTLGGAEPVACR